MCETRIFMHTFNLNSISQMKKKIFSALLMGVFTLASMSMFVSCKDYDDDINNLDAEQQTLKSDLETLKKDVDAKYTDLSGQLSTALQNAQEALSSAQDAQALIAEVQTTAEEAGKAAAAAQTAADGAQDAAEAAQKTAEDALEAAKKALEAIGVDESGVSLVEKVADLSERVGNLETLAEGIPELIAKLDEAATKEELDEVKAEVEKYQDYFDSIFAMVTSVSLYSSQGLANNLDLTFNQVTEKENKFPAEASVADNQFTFTKDFIRTYDDEVVVRVSPTNATLTAENITLINSQGVELTDLVECTNVERYEGLLSRAATTGNGLWTVTFKLKDGYNPDDFAAATTTKNGAEAVLFAVAVKNTDYNDVDRRVISSYDLTVEGADAGIAANTFDVQGNDGVWRNIDKANGGKGVKNRYFAAEDGTPTTNIEELAWIDNTKPATAAILEGSNRNANKRVGVNPDPKTDNRQDGLLLPAEVDKAINIRIDWDAKNDKANKDIKGFYVTLDKNFAVESVPSELNAWNSYTYENVGTDKQAAHLFEGNTGSITIKNMGNVTGDVIGFRVYAVNLDGTLLDPDGRAFYVAVGNASSTATITGEIIATTQNNSESDFIAVEKGTFFDYSYHYGWEPSEDNATVNGAAVSTTEFTVKYYDEDKNEITNKADYDEIAFVKFVMPNALYFVDGATYTQTLKLYNSVAGKHVLAKTITAVMTKKLPTAFPTSFAIKEGQNIGDNTIRPFIVPENGWAVTTKATEGKADLKDLLYMMSGTPLALDKNYSFNFLTSAADADEDGTDDAVAVKYGDPVAGGYFLPIADDFIDDETVHAVEVSYLYQNVSAYKKADGTWYTGAHAVDYDNTLNAQYACWHHDMSWAWYTKEENRAVNTTLTWTNPGATSILQAGWIKISSSRDAEFAGSLYSLISGKKYVEVVKGSATLTTESGQVSPYFVPTIDPATGDITCTQVDNQDAQAPYQNHTEKLSFKVKDVYDHEITISLPVQIVNPVLPTE